MFINYVLGSIRHCKRTIKLRIGVFKITTIINTNVSGKYVGTFTRRELQFFPGFHLQNPDHYYFLVTARLCVHRFVNSYKVGHLNMIITHLRTVAGFQLNSTQVAQTYTRTYTQVRIKYAAIKT